MFGKYIGRLKSYHLHIVLGVLFGMLLMHLKKEYNEKSL